MFSAVHCRCKVSKDSADCMFFQNHLNLTARVLVFSDLCCIICEG